MKLIKINTDHYVVVDNSEIKMDDWYLDDTNTVRQAITEAESYWTHRKHYKKVTHSTQPLEKVEWGWGKLGYIKIQELSLQEVKELIGEVDVEKKVEEVYPQTYYSGIHIDGFLKAGYVKGYNQALEDNKEKKYTEEDILDAWELGASVGLPLTRNKKETLFKAVQPKTEWEVEIVDGKLKLK